MDAARPTRSPPPEHIRLMMAAFMAFIKGAVVSAILVVPFLGVWAAVGTSLVFTCFCVWLAHKKGPAMDAQALQPVSDEADSDRMERTV